MSDELMDLNLLPKHMRPDFHKRNELVLRGVKRCSRCGGTGNELLSMYRRCQACGGDGESKGNEDRFPD